MKIGLIVAMESEFSNVRAALGGVTEGRYKDSGNDVVLRQCGIGKVNAAIGTMKLITEHNPDCIISTGLAGGIGDELNVWDVVVASEMAYHDVFCGMGCEEGQVQGLPTRFEASPRLVQTAMSLELDNIDAVLHKGLICTGDQFITAENPVREILRKFPDALACDMESAAIAHVCHLQGVPFMSIRVISDTPLKTRDHALQWEESLKVMTGRSFDIVNRLLEKL